MSEFKSMVRMCTSQPKEVLKLANGGSVRTTKMSSTKFTTGYQALKSGGTVNKANGGAMGAMEDSAKMRMAMKGMAKKQKPMGGRPMPSGLGMAAATPPTASNIPAMKYGGKAMMGGGQMTDKEEKMDKKVHKHEGNMHPGKPLTKLKTGGVTSKAKNDGKAYYKDGGAIGSSSKNHARGVSGMPGGSAPAPTKATLKGNDAEFAKTKVNTHTESTKSSSRLKDYGASGEVPKTKPGGYKNGGGVVPKFAFGGPADQPSTEGKKDGGVTKKAYANGGKVGMNVEKLPQGKKAPSAPVRINQLSGTFKDGGKVRC